MARISSYDQDSSLNVADKLLGTDSATGATKNFTINSVLGLANDDGLVQAFDGSTFQFTNYVAPVSSPQGILNLNEGSAVTTSFSTINQIFISVKDTSGLSLAEYLDNTANDFIKISKKDNLNNFGIFEVTAIESSGSGEYRKLTVTPRGTNGNLTAGVKYFVANYSAQLDQNFSDDSITEFGDVNSTFFSGSTATELTAAGSGSIITNAERTSLTNFTSNGLIHGDVVDNLTTNTTDVPLSANQGLVLKGLIDTIDTLLSSDDSTLDQLQEVVDYIKINKSDLQTLTVTTIPGLQTAINAKEDSVAGKGLSANDFTDTLLTKLGGIAAGAEVNVAHDYTTLSNKPTDVTVLSNHVVTDLQDVTSTGSGAIISSSERDSITSTHATFIGLSSAERTKLTGIDVNTSTNVVTDGTDTIAVIPTSRTIELAGTANEIEVSPAGAQDLSTNRTFTIGLPNNVTVTNDITGNSIIKSGGTSTQILLADGSVIDLTIESQGITNNDSDTKVPSNAAVKDAIDTAISNLVDGAPTALDTLNELAAALGDNASFSTTVTNSIGNSLRFDSSQTLTSSQKTQALTNLGITSTVQEINFLDGVTSTLAYKSHTVTVGSKTGGGNAFYVDGKELPVLVILPETKYRFDLADSSNFGHDFQFTEDISNHNPPSSPAASHANTTYVTAVGTPGQSGSYIEIIGSYQFPTLFYYSPNSTGMGGRVGNTLSGAGTANKVPLWISTTEIGDSIITESSGNVGIGTTTPGTKFHVKNSVSLPAAGSEGGTAKFGGSGYGLVIGADSNGKGYIQSQRSDGTATTYDLMVQPNGGNVGIGTASPSAKLHIENTGDAISFTRSGQETYKITHGTSGLYFTRPNTSAVKFGITQNSDFDIFDTAGNVMFRADSSSGDVGIGTTTPATNLEIKSTGNTTVRLSTDGGASSKPELQLFRNTNDYGTIRFVPGGGNSSGLHLIDYRNDSNSHIIFNTRGENERMRIESDGKVGIGTTSPSTELDVTGDVTATTFLGELTGTINTATTAVTQANATNNTTVATTAYVDSMIGTIPAGLVFQGAWNANTNTPTLTSGSGTTGHFYIVSVAGSTNLDGITDWQVGDWAVFVEQGATDQWEKIDNSSVLDGAGLAGQIAYWSSTSQLAGNTNLFFDSTNDRVGIGTSSPTYKLDVEGNIRGEQYLYIKDTGGTKSLSLRRELNYSTIDNGTENLNYNALNHLFLSGLSEKMRITSAGNVGIGTASPATKLDVANSNIQITNTAWKSSSEQVAGNLKFNLGGSSSERANSVAEIIGLDTTTSQYNGALAFNTLGSNTSAERMRIDSSGNVGIGTESPSSLLHISKDGGSGGVVSTIENTNAAFSSSYSGLTLKTGLNTAEIKAVSGAGGAGYLSFINESSERMRIDSTGQVQFNNYTSSSSFTGTAAANLAVDSSGNIITEASSGGSIDDLSDVDITTNAPSTGQILKWDGTNFVPGTDNSGSASSDSFTTISVSGQTNVVADSSTDTLTLVGGTNVSITTDASTDTVTINSDAAASIGVSVINSDTTAAADNLYVLTANLTLTLPSSPSAGDSIKISNRSAVETCVIARNGSNIMGSAANLTLDNATSSFELIYSDATNGWVIIGQ